MFAKTLEVNGSLAQFNWRIVILFPNWSNPKELIKWQQTSKLEFKSINQKKPNNIYATKFILATFIDCLQDFDEVLYLDYDHICLRRINLPLLHDNCIHISSETGCIDDIVINQLEDNGKLSFYNILNGIHYNNSLIHGKVQQLKNPLRIWETVYNELQNKAPDRYREELSFAIAVKQSGLNLRNISSKIQSTWSHNEKLPTLFHYGGENRYSYAAKRLIHDIMKLDEPDRNDFIVLNKDVWGRRIIDIAEVFKLN